MTDAEYLFRQDIREKKSANRGARAKVSGSKTKYCGLPSDNLTAAQLKRRNSPVYTYNISKCLSFDEFKRLPDDLKRQYLSKLTTVYSVPLKTIAASMGCAKSSMSRYAEQVGFHVSCRYKVPTPDNKWFDFVAGKLTADGAPVGEQPQQDNDSEHPVDTAPSVEYNSPTTADNTSTYVPVYPTSGKFVITCTQAELNSYLCMSLPTGTQYEFSIQFKLITTDETKRGDCSIHSPLHPLDREA